MTIQFRKAAQVLSTIVKCSGGRRCVSSVATSSEVGLKAQVELLNSPLEVADPDLHSIIELEKQRQRNSINLIASENYTSRAVMQALGSVMQNKYSEGYPGARYYGGNEFIDQAELLCQKRALEAFRLDPEQWGVNVQSLSGSPANLHVYAALLKPHERIMGLDLPHGGHLSHGYQTATKKISMVSSYFETFPYRVNEETGFIDYDECEKLAVAYRPKVLIAGASAYPRKYDYGRMKSIATKCGAYLMADIAHVSGMMAAGVLPSPFESCDIVTTTTHKSLRGPRGSLIFYRKGIRSYDKKKNPIKFNLEEPINFSVFPGHQGGPHNHTISALAVALKQVNTDEFKVYQARVLNNNQAFALRLLEKGHKLVSGGTDNHLVVLDLRPKNLDGARVEKVMELCNIAANKNTVPGDANAIVPKGLRMGSPAMTTRGFGEEEFKQVADIVDECVNITGDIMKEHPELNKVKEFEAFLKNEHKNIEGISKLKERVIKLCQSFPTVGFTEDEMKFTD